MSSYSRIGCKVAVVCLLGLFVCCPAWGGECEGKRPGGRGPQHSVRRGWGHQRETLRCAMDKFKQEHPEDYERLCKLRESDRESYFKELGNFIPRNCVFSAKLMALDQDCFRLARQHRQARTEAEREVLKSELTQKVEESVDLMLEDFRARLEMMRKQLDRKVDQRDKLVLRRVEQLLRKRRGDMQK